MFSATSRLRDRDAQTVLSGYRDDIEALEHIEEALEQERKWRKCAIERRVSQSGLPETLRGATFADLALEGIPPIERFCAGGWFDGKGTVLCGRGVERACAANRAGCCAARLQRAIRDLSGRRSGNGHLRRAARESPGRRLTAHLLGACDW